MSKLKAVKPVVKKTRLKLFLYGDAKVGKTTLALQFPKPYIIDTEQTTDKKKYVDLIEKSGGDVFETQNFDDLMDQVHALLTENHDYKTLVIDSLTNLYGDLVDKSEMKMGNAFGKHTHEAARQMKRLFNLLLRLDMNVIITSHAKDKYVMGKDSSGKQEMTYAGTTFDCFKKLDYLFDLILEVQKRGATDRIVIVKGTRLEEFNEYDTFPNTYEEFSKRYDKDTLERLSVSQTFATEKQLHTLKTLFDVLDVSEKSKSAWLTQLKAGTFDESSEEGVQKLIDKLTEKLNEKLQPQAA